MNEIHALKEGDYEVDANAQVWRLRGVAVEGCGG
jgi:hypothetical protein